MLWMVWIGMRLIEVLMNGAALLIAIVIVLWLFGLMGNKRA